MPIKGRASDGTGDFSQRIIGLVCVGILYGARLGAWHLGHGAIDGNGVARAVVTEPVFAICERVAEVQALLNDHFECGKHTAADVVAKAQAVLSESALLRAMFDVGYFPPNMPPE
jgi:hypothetical protein